jgi:hypothetical protein
MTSTLMIVPHIPHPRHVLGQTLLHRRNTCLNFAKSISRRLYGSNVSATVTQVEQQTGVLG